MTKADMIPIELTAESIEHLGSNFYHIRHIFNALRERKELLEQPDYKRLYDEAQDFLFRHAVEFSVGTKTDVNGDMIGLNFLPILTIPTMIIMKNTP